MLCKQLACQDSFSNSPKLGRKLFIEKLNKIKDKRIQMLLLDVYNNKSTATRIDFSNMGLRYEQTRQLCEMINFGYDKIGDEEVRVLAVALKNNDMVTSIDVTNNDITGEGGKVLGEALYPPIRLLKILIVLLMK